MKLHKKSKFQDGIVLLCIMAKNENYNGRMASIDVHNMFKQGIDEVILFAKLQWLFFYIDTETQNFLNVLFHYFKYFVSYHLRSYQCSGQLWSTVAPRKSSWEEHISDKGLSGIWKQSLKLKLMPVVQSIELRFHLNIYCSVLLLFAFVGNMLEYLFVFGGSQYEIFKLRRTNNEAV